MNKVILIGRLVRDPELRYTQAEEPMAIARYTLAVERRGKRSQDGNESNADFISCVAFGRLGEFAEKYMAVPVVKGVKSANERFAGALDTYTIEAMMQDGKALQSGTSHFLGQNFAKAFDVQFVNKENKLEN